MSVIRIDGFDAYVPQGQPPEGDFLPSTGYTLYSSAPGGTNDITAAPGVGPGSSSFQFDRTLSYYSNLQYGFSSDADQVVVGFAFFGSYRDTLFDLNGEVTVGWETSGQLSLNGEVGPHVIVLSRWYYVEVEMDRTTDKLTLWVNDTEYLQTDLPAALKTEDTWAMTLGWQQAGNDALLRFDDLVVVDSAGVEGEDITERMGPVENVLLNADAEDTLQFDNPSSKTAVEVVNNAPPEENVFIESQISGSKALFTSLDIAAERDVLALTVVGVLSKTDLDERQVGLMVQNATGDQEVDFEVDLVFKYKQTTFARDADGTPWSPAKVNSTAWGAVVRP